MWDVETRNNTGDFILWAVYRLVEIWLLETVVLSFRRTRHGACKHRNAFIFLRERLELNNRPDIHIWGPHQRDRWSGRLVSTVITRQSSSSSCISERFRKCSGIADNSMKMLEKHNCAAITMRWSRKREYGNSSTDNKTQRGNMSTSQSKIKFR